MNEIKYLPISEFRKLGYLQEVNRQFFHPLGLALEITIDDNGEERLSGIWDLRDDNEGNYYNLKEANDERIKSFQTKADFIQSEFEKRG